MSNLEFTDSELKAIREEWCRGATDAQFSLFISEAKARNLRPGVHLFFMLRQTNEWDPNLKAKVRSSKATWITKIDAFRLISQRTGKDAGRGKTRWIYLDDRSMPTIESTIPLPHPDDPHLPREPYACVVPIYRSDYKEPIEVVCRFDAFAVTMKTDNGLILTEMWQRRGPEQLEKCSEVASRRAGYPEELGSLYIQEEFKPDEPLPSSEPAPVVAVPEAPSVPKVDQTPAVPTQSPRPGEKSAGEQLQERQERSQKILRESLPLINEFVANPEVVAQLAKEGKEVDHDAIQALVTSGGADLPTKTETIQTPLPEKPRRGRKPKNSPVNGQLGDPRWTSAEEMEAIAATEKVEKTEENKREAQEFVEAVTSFTAEQAVAHGLPVPEDPLPAPDEFKMFVSRMRNCTGPGVDIQTLGAYSFKYTKKTAAKYFTIGDWTWLLETIEAAKTAGTLAELVRS